MIKNRSERRWLLKNVPEIALQFEKISIVQFYINRIKYRKVLNITNRTSEEFYQIDERDCNLIEIKSIQPLTFYNKMKFATSKKIFKYRTLYKIGNLNYEIDEFISLRLVVLEIENADASNINFPEEIKQEIILEITNLKEFSNYNLSLIAKPNEI